MNDQERFVRDYGTGNAMPDPPQFVNYANPDTVPASSSRPTSRPANFVRSSNRVNQPRGDFIPPPDEEPNTNNNVAGLGSGRRNSVSVPDPAVNPVQRQVNGYGPGGSGQSSTPPTTGDASSPQKMLNTGDLPQLANQDREPQNFRPGHSSAGSKVGQDGDPLAKQMADLRSASTGGRRNSFVQRDQQPESGPAKVRDYSTSADAVVGGYPTPSRPVSPSQPTAALMRPPQNSGPSPNTHVDNVLANYEQSLPWEAKSHSRSASRQSQVVPNQLLDRPASRDGFAGIGSQGRSPSPGFNGSGQRNPSPTQPHQGSRPSTTPGSTPGHIARQDSVNIPQQKLPGRATTPNSVGISLDTTGKVAIDAMADVYQTQPQPQQNQGTPQPSQYHAPPQNPQSTGFQRRLSQSNGSMNTPAQHQHVPPQTQPPYGAPPPAPYQPPPAQQPPPQQQQPHYIHPPSQQPPPITYQPHYQPQPQPEYTQPPAHPAYTQPQQGLTRAQSVSTAYYQQVVQPQPQQMVNGYRSTSPQPMHNPPVQAQPHGVSAAPTGQYTEGGQPVLFYGMFHMSKVFKSVSRHPLFLVKALYDYTASIEEEFDFQAGDIIAVISTPEDGWWSGELLDEARRQRGRHVFPSNFVCLF